MHCVQHDLSYECCCRLPHKKLCEPSTMTMHSLSTLCYGDAASVQTHDLRYVTKHIGGTQCDSSVWKSVLVFQSHRCVQSAVLLNYHYKGRAHTHFVDLIHMFTHLQSMYKPLIEFQLYSTLYTVMRLKYVMEQSSISAQYCRWSCIAVKFLATSWQQH